MATIIVCDGGCKAQSPDAEGLHVANEWIAIEVRVYGRAPGPQPEKIFCETCWARIKQAMQP